MWFNRLFWFGAGAMVGVVASRLIERPEGRAMVKRALTQGFALQDLLTVPLERFKEDVSDLFAEAREEYTNKTQGPTPAEDGIAVVQ